MRRIILKDNTKAEKEMKLSLGNVHLGMCFTYTDSKNKRKKFTVCKESRGESETAPEVIKHFELLENSDFKLGEVKSKLYFEALLAGRFGPYEGLEVYLLFYKFKYFC